MKIKYIYPEEVIIELRKDPLKKTLKEHKSKFLYYELLDDFGDVIKRYSWNTDKYTLTKLDKTDRLVKVMLKYPEVKHEECLF